MNNSSNFSCLIPSEVSSSIVSDPSHWSISEDLLYGTPIVATVYAIFFVLAFFWNLFIIITYLVKYKLLNEPGNIFLLNLAIVDFLLTITVLMFSLVTEIAQEFVFGSNDVIRCNLCQTAGFFIMFLNMSSLHLLTALSIDRFIHLARPLRYPQIMNKWKAIVVIVCVWVWCFILGILPIVGFGQNEFNIRFGGCLPRFTGDNPRTGINNFYYAAFIAFEALIPVLILGFTNVWTYRFVSKFLKRNLRRRSTFRKRGDTDQSQDERKHHKQQGQLVRVFGALFISNIISWTPTIICVIIIFIIPARLLPDEIYILGWICFLTTVVFHPILESFFVKDLRYQIKRAKRGVRRASTAVYRQTTQLFSSTALDEANRKMDEESPTNRRKMNESGITEVSEMPSEGSSPNHSGHVSPEHNTPVKRVKLEKAGRSVTFSENGPPIPFQHTNGKSALRKGRARSPPPFTITEEENSNDHDADTNNIKIEMEDQVEQNGRTPNTDLEPPKSNGELESESSTML